MTSSKSATTGEKAAIRISAIRFGQLGQTGTEWITETARIIDSEISAAGGVAGQEKDLSNIRRLVLSAIEVLNSNWWGGEGSKERTAAIRCRSILREIVPRDSNPANCANDPETSDSSPATTLHAHIAKNKPCAPHVA